MLKHWKYSYSLSNMNNFWANHEYQNILLILHIYHHDNIYSKIISASCINNLLTESWILCFIDSDIY